MSFQSLSFLVFLALTVPLCLIMGRKRRNAAAALLTVACAVFYLWDFDRLALAGFLVLLGGSCVTWAAVSARKPWMYGAAACWHIGCLLWYKCAGFWGLSRGWMPLGLSFFTFQQLWLLRETGQGRFSLNREDWPDFALYCFFFPTVTSGPILRPEAFFPQLQGSSFLHPDAQDIAAGLYALCLGFAKKVLLADPLGLIVSNGWAAAGALTVPAVWVTMLSYTLQLYLDFSGYCDIATGCARLLGVRLPENFRSPYRSLSVTEFWKRWHMTLTTFLRECLYFPLGGSRRGTVRTCANILLVFLVSGIWHGNGWTFLIWGLLHGCAQILERLWGPGRDRLPKAIRWLGTMAFVNFAWVFFRAPDLTAAAALLANSFSGGSTGITALSAGVLEGELDSISTLIPSLADPAAWLLPIALLAAGTAVVLWPRRTRQQMEEFRPTVLSAVVPAALMIWAVLSFSGVTTFLYSNF